MERKKATWLKSIYPNHLSSEQFSMESLISGKQFLQFPLKEYLINNLKKIEEDVILDMAKSLIERIVKNDGVEEGTNFERVFIIFLIEG